MKRAEWWSAARALPTAHHSLVRIPLSAGIPLVFASSALLLAFRATRGIALASIPPRLFLTFCLRNRQTQYMLPEIALFVTAVAIVAATALVWAAGRTLRGRLRAAGAPLAAVLFGAYLCGYVFGEVAGRLQPDDPYALVDELRREDRPIRFYPQSAPLRDAAGR